METLQYQFKPKTTVYYVARLLFNQDCSSAYTVYEGWIGEVRITIDSCDGIVRTKYYVISLMRGESRLFMEGDLDLCETQKENYTATLMAVYGKSARRISRGIALIAP